MNTQNYSVKRCLIKESLEIRSLLQERFQELDLYARDVIKDSQKHKYNINAAQLSHYLKSGNVKGTLSQEDIIWLCYRYGIKLNVSAEILPFDDKKCLQTLKKNF